MKNRILISSLVCFMCLFSACNDWLEEDPYSIATATYYNTVEEAQSAVLAPLYKLRSAYPMGLWGVRECSSEYMIGRSSWADISAFQGLGTTNITRTDTFWDALYKAIKDCNVAIDALADASDMTEDEISSYTGELRFLRGWCYYELARSYGHAPLRTEENMTEWDLEMSSADVIYDYVIADLQYAIENAPETSREVGTPSRGAAQSALAMVYLELEDYASAKQYAGDVIGSGNYSLVTVSSPRDFDNIFGPDLVSSTEEIFYLKSSRTDNLGWDYPMLCAHSNALVGGQKMHGAGGWYGIYALSSNALIDGWDADDYRKEFNILDVASFSDDPGNLFGISLAENEKIYIPTKFYDPNATGAGAANLSRPLIRYADVLLIYAEAAAKEANAPTSDALEKLNMVHRRAYGKDPLVASDVDLVLSDYTTLDAFMDKLADEEAYEHYNEGKRWPFLVRTGLAAEIIKNVRGIDIAEACYLFPIPSSEFTYNKAIDESVDQNPGY